MSEKAGNIVSLVDVRLPELRDEITELRERLQRVTNIFVENEASFKVVAHIALTIQGADTPNGIDDAIGKTMTQDSGDVARFYINQPICGAVDLDYVHSLTTLKESTRKSLLGLKQTRCEVCRPEAYKELLDVDVEDFGSMAKIPVAFKGFRGVLIIGSEDPDLFNHEAGTLYLDFLGETLARSAYRVMAA